MKLASYHGTRPGVIGLGNILIRWRLKGDYSHNEVVFEPCDGVDHLMPDGTCAPDANGALWCASSTGLDRIPTWSRARPGRLGGVRFKRIALDPGRWTLDTTAACPLTAAQWACANEGKLYDWQFIAGFLAWAIPNKRDRVACSEACAEMLAMIDSWRFDPCNLRAAVASAAGKVRGCEGL